MKFNKIGAGILGLSLLFCGYVFGANSYIQVADNPNNRTFNRDVVFYNQYVGGVGMYFSGSSTASGGTSTFSAGTVYTNDCINAKDFSLLITPASGGGSCTVNLYGVFGTTTVGNGTESAGVSLLNSTSYAGLGTASSSVVSITTHPNLVAVGFNVLSGTVTLSVSMTSQTAR